MLRNAILACGALHLQRVNPDEWREETAKNYYHLALQDLTNQMLLESTSLNKSHLALTSLVLNTYEFMGVSMKDRLTLLKRSRSLIQDCEWSSTSEGIGGACFWIYIYIELMNCLSLKCAMAWNPDQWGLDSGFLGRPDGQRGGVTESLWTRRIIYIVSKVVQFLYGQPQVQQKQGDWLELKGMMDDWYHRVPVTLRPLGWIPAGKSVGRKGRYYIQSRFPQLYLPDPLSVLAQIIFHTGMVLLSDQNPDMELRSSIKDEMGRLQLRHAHAICGIVKYIEDRYVLSFENIVLTNLTRCRGIASFVIRSSVIASKFLTNPDEQREMIDILQFFEDNTGWRLSTVRNSLKTHWQWPSHTLEDVRRSSHPSVQTSYQTRNLEISQNWNISTRRSILTPGQQYYQEQQQQPLLINQTMEPPGVRETQSTIPQQQHAVAQFMPTTSTHQHQQRQQLHHLNTQLSSSAAGSIMSSSPLTPQSSSSIFPPSAPANSRDYRFPATTTYMTAPHHDTASTTIQSYQQQHSPQHQELHLHHPHGGHHQQHQHHPHQQGQPYQHEMHIQGPHFGSF